jgi:hypothetical protein
MATLTQASPTAAQLDAVPPVHLQTTLYDLIAAINAEAEPEEDALVLATLVHLLQTYRITCTQGSTTYRLLCNAPDHLCQVAAAMRVVSEP